MPNSTDGRPVYRVRKSSNYYAIGMPPEIGTMLVGKPFAWSITENGFSYTPVEEADPEGLPEWVKRLERT